MQIVQFPAFIKTVKKLHANAKRDLMVHQLTLLAYMYDESNENLTLLALGSHENFYRDLKRRAP